jgi:D-glycero-alpha-D-manno-heptose-7-phosphate kinase
VIITRSPLRITLGGGGTDLPSYYEEFGGFLIAAAIDKYVFVTVTRPFKTGIYLKYSQLERVDQVDQVRHPIIREALRLMNLCTPQIEITTLADIPAGTGLGSSGAFTAALLKALYAYRRDLIHPSELAELAWDIECQKLDEPIGKQDQYIAAMGGLTCFDFRQDGTVATHTLKIDVDLLHQLEDNLLLFFTGYSRSAGDVLRDQKVRTTARDADMLANLHYVKEIGLKSREALERGDLHRFGELMHEHWENKKKRSRCMSNSKINAWYELGRQAGAVGGKLVGAGGGGFLLFYSEQHRALRDAMREAGLDEVRFRFDFEGTKVIFS